MAVPTAGTVAETVPGRRRSCGKTFGTTTGAEKTTNVEFLRGAVE